MKSLWMNRGSLATHSALDDRGFLFGQRVMTTLLWNKQKFVDLDRHIDRLFHHADLFGLNVQTSKAEINFELEACLEQLNRDVPLACRIFFTAGVGAAKGSVSTDRWIHVQEFSERPNTGIKLGLVQDSFWRRGERVKTGIYENWFSQLPQAQRNDVDDVVWCNGDQEVSECTTANIFLIGRDGDLVEIATPPASSGIVLGVTRRRIVELLGSAKIPVTERVIDRSEIARFDEAFVTSSLQGIVPVIQLGNHKLHSTRPNSVVSHVQRLYATWSNL
jgi:branched-subunit amino acid aminotransferase/4-amino-4-deoxychorismate lyase